MAGFNPITEAPTRLKPGRKPGKAVKTKRVLSPESRARIVVAQKALWAKVKKAA
jgi:hypothetical protein